MRKIGLTPSRNRTLAAQEVSIEGITKKEGKIHV